VEAWTAGLCMLHDVLCRWIPRTAYRHRIGRDGSDCGDGLARSGQEASEGRWAAMDHGRDGMMSLRLLAMDAIFRRRHVWERVAASSGGYISNDAPAAAAAAAAGQTGGDGTRDA
jgi:hypothetical protein